MIIHDNRMSPGTSLCRFQKHLILMMVFICGEMLMGLGFFNTDLIEHSPAQRPLDPQRFLNPPAESMPGVLWFWHQTDMTPEIIRAQMKQMHAAGFSGIMMFPLHSNPPFYTEAFYELFEVVLRQAKNLGMVVWIASDNQIPHGWGAEIIVGGGNVGDRVFEPRPDLRAQKILHVQETLKASGLINLRKVFPGISTLPPAVQIAEGRLKSRGCDMVIGNKGADWTDYMFSLDMMPENWGKHYPFREFIPGLYVQTEWVFRAEKQTDSGYAWAISDKTELGDGVPALKKMIVKDGKVTGQLPSTKLPFELNEDTFYHIETKLTGNRIETFINGQSVDVTEDDTFKSGSVGIRLPNPEMGQYDNFKVIAPDSTVLYEDDFENNDQWRFFAPLMSADKIFAVAAMPIINGKPAAKGMLDLTELFLKGKSWDTPKGTWAVEFFGKDFVKEMPVNYPDLLNPQTLERHVRIIYEEVRRRFPWAMDSAFKGFWNDEPAIAWNHGFYVWSETFPKTFEKQDSSSAKVLASVFNDLGRAGRRIRAHYYKAIVNGWSDPFYRIQGQWAAHHGLDFITNPVVDDAPPSAAIGGGDDLLNNQWASVPGVDAIYGQILPTNRSLVPRWATSSSNQLGNERVLFEVFGGYGWDVTPELVRYVNGNLMARGCNLVSYHAFWTNPDAVYFAPPFDPSNTWWFAQKHINLWNGRVQEMGLGLAISNTALINPASTIYARAMDPEIFQMDQAFREAYYAMEDMQVAFDLLDEGCLNDDPAMTYKAKPVKDGLRVGLQKYKVTVLPAAATFSLKAIQILKQMVQNGGVVIAYQSMPQEEIDGRDEELQKQMDLLFGEAPSDTPHPTGKGWAAFAKDISQLKVLLDKVQARLVRLEPACEKVRVLKRQRRNATVYLVMNEGENAIRPTITFLETGTPELWDPDDGSQRMAPIFNTGDSTTVLPLSLEPYKLMIVIFRKDSLLPHLTECELDVLSVRVDKDNLIAEVIVDQLGTYPLKGTDGKRDYSTILNVDLKFEPIALDGKWQFAFENEVNSSREVMLGSWTEIKPDYSGKARYEYRLQLPANALRENHRWLLDLGKVHDVAEVEINGITVQKPLLWRPYRLNVTEMLQPGKNTIVVRVTNTLANRHGTAKDSGLLGPVLLRPQETITVEMDRD